MNARLAWYCALLVACACTLSRHQDASVSGIAVIAGDLAPALPYSRGSHRWYYLVNFFGRPALLFMGDTACFEPLTTNVNDFGRVGSKMALCDKAEIFPLVDKEDRFGRVAPHGMRDYHQRPEHFLRMKWD